MPAVFVFGRAQFRSKGKRIVDVPVVERRTNSRNQCLIVVNERTDCSFFPIKSSRSLGQDRLSPRFGIADQQTQCCTSIQNEPMSWIKVWCSQKHRSGMTWSDLNFLKRLPVQVANNGS